MAGWLNWQGQVDEVNLTLGYEADIARFEQRQRGELSWL
jgi:hypothetical protein